MFSKTFDVGITHIKELESMKDLASIQYLKRDGNFSLDNISCGVFSTDKRMNIDLQIVQKAYASLKVSNVVFS